VRRALVLLWIGVSAVATPQPETVIDDEVRVGAGKIRTLDLDFPSPGARVVCEYHVVEGKSGVRALLMRRADADKWRHGRPNRVLAGTAFDSAGEFSYHTRNAGDYVLVLDNRLQGHGSSLVHLRVLLVRGEAAPPRRYAPDPVRARIVVWAGAVFFLSVVSLGGLRLRRAWERRPLWPEM
jgi:hypothetical protein